MRTLASLEIVLVGLVLATACEYAPQPQTNPDDFLLPPQSLASSSGVIVEVSELTFGSNCIRLSLKATGLRDGEFAAFSAISIYLPGSSAPMELTEWGGGFDRSGDAPDGSYFVALSVRYHFNPPKLEGPIPLTVQFITDDALDGPLVFHLRAIPAEPCEL